MHHKRLNLHFFGPQGSGKGTQAEILANKLKLINISAGQLFRDRAKLNDKFGLILKNVLRSGELIPVGIHERIIEETISRTPNVRGFVFDGVIRNRQQMATFNKLWPKFNLDEPILIVLEISDRESVKRIEKRRTCLKCDNISIAENHEKLTICPECGSKMVQRSDDHKEAIQKRLSIYHQETKPMIDFFQIKNRVVLIDGYPTIPQVTELIIKALKLKKLL